MPRHSMIARGDFTFHGSFKSKILAAKMERKIPGSFIHEKDGLYYVLKPKRKTTNPRIRKTSKVVRIYKDITRIEGTKGPDSQYPGEKFFHNFKKPYPEMIGLRDGSLLIRSKRRK